MQIERYKTFLVELENQRKEWSNTSALAYRFWDGQWFDESDVIIGDDSLRKTLDRTLEKDCSWRESSSCDCFFPVKEFKTVICTHTSSPIRKATRRKIAQEIAACLQHANHAFDAAHDGLTGLLNGNAIEHEILLALSSPSEDSEIGDQSLASSHSREHLALISLDLDHFKQVNDSYGHEYGDVVLMCFAKRVYRGLNNLEGELPKQLQFQFGRPGGEEFLVLVTGPLSQELVQDVADQVRQTIGAEGLPTESEWASISDEKKPAGLQLPHLAERRVTASIGISSIVSTPTKQDPCALYTVLKREADAALYRAKAGGRNPVRFFPAIRSQYGTVVQHHNETGIVVIDLGTLVNVSVGHEFLVYHPDFTGDKDFLYSDGRSTKRLGKYPRHASGRIEVFETQREISFCRVAQIEGLQRFPVGSLLEFIPVGAITHLIAPEIGTGVLSNTRLSSVLDLQEGLKTLINKKKSSSPVVDVYTFKNIEEVERTRGTAFVNRSLANLFQQLERHYPSSAYLSQVTPYQFAVLSLFTTEKEHSELVKEVLLKSSQECSGLSVFGTGTYYNHKSKLGGDASILEISHALDYARYAAAPETLGELDFVIFTPKVAAQTLGRLRLAHKYREALADYQKLRVLGIDEGNCENQAALCYFEMSDPDLEMARKSISRANELLPDDEILWANRAIIEYACGESSQAHKTFMKIYDINPGYVLSAIYLRSRAMAAYSAYREDNSSINRSELASLLEKALKAPRPKNLPIENKELQNALFEVVAKTGSTPP